MNDLLQTITYAVHDLGLWGYPLAVALMMGIAILPIPAEIPAVMNGMLFGPVVGTLITWTGAVAGAQVSFELSRRFGRPFVQRVVPDRMIGKVDDAVTLVGWPALFFARLIPAIAFTALNWGVGLTACRRGTFFWTTALGVLPGTILFVVSGRGLARVYAQRPGVAVLLVVAAVLSMALLAYQRRRKSRARKIVSANVGAERERIS